MIAFVLAGLAAGVYGAGSILQAVGARKAVAATGTTAGVLRQWSYLAGLGCDLAGWLLSLLALRTLPLFAVQAVLAGSVAVTVILAAIVFNVALTPGDLIAVAAVTVAVVVIGLSAGPKAHNGRATVQKPVSSWRSY